MPSMLGGCVIALQFELGQSLLVTHGYRQSWSPTPSFAQIPVLHAESELQPVSTAPEPGPGGVQKPVSCPPTTYRSQTWPPGRLAQSPSRTQGSVVDGGWQYPLAQLDMGGHTRSATATSVLDIEAQ